MGYTTRLEWEPLRSIDSATLTGVYQALGLPLAFPSYKCKLVNNSTSLILISNDGINDKDIAPGNSFWLYDEGTVAQSGSFPALPAGTQIYIKGSAGTGPIYLVSQYIVVA
jgi:hypothetical protein